MKNKILSLLAVSIVSLTSCTLFNSFSSFVQRLCVYNIDKIQDGDNIDSAFDTTVDARFKDHEPYIPYITLKQYASLYESHFYEGVESRYNKTATSVNWSLYRNDQLCFVTEINFVSKTVRAAGSIYSAIRSDDNQKDLKALSYGSSTHYDGWYLSGNGYAEYTFGNHSIKYFTYNNNYYISLGFLDMTYSSDSGIYFYYNYQRIVSTNEADHFEDVHYIKPPSSRKDSVEMFIVATGFLDQERDI